MLLGRRGNYLQGDAEINALFSGIKGVQTPPPPHPHGGGLCNLRCNLHTISNYFAVYEHPLSKNERRVYKTDFKYI